MPTLIDSPKGQTNSYPYCRSGCGCVKGEPEKFHDGECAWVEEPIIDALVRDLTTIHPMPKSEVRRRIDEIIAEVEKRKVEEIRKRIQEMINSRKDIEGEKFNFTLQDLLNELS